MRGALFSAGAVDGCSPPQRKEVPSVPQPLWPTSKRRKPPVPQPLWYGTCMAGSPSSPSLQALSHQHLSHSQIRIPWPNSF